VTGATSATGLATVAASAPSNIPSDIAFWVVAVLAVGAAIMMLFSRKAVHAALWVALIMGSLAIMYIMEGAVFLGIVQIVVYTGAVMMLFLFVLMLVGVDSADSVVETLRGQRFAAAVAGLGLVVLLVGAIGNSHTGNAVGTGTVEAIDGGNVPALARLIFSRYLWAFEVTSALLITAATGAMLLAHRERVVRRRTQRELSVMRTHSGSPQLVTAPGVYARHNAVDTAGLLPDGTPSPVTVPEAIAEISPRTPVPLNAPGRDQLEPGPVGRRGDQDGEGDA
jgi:NADH-quinone oxidoreductase subunit J